MAIQLRGCDILPFSAEEQQAVTDIGIYCESLTELGTGLPKGTIKVEFAKAVAVEQTAQCGARFNDGAPFYVMQISRQDNSTFPKNELKMYLMQMAFNSAAGSVDYKPSLIRNFRGDLKDESVKAITQMLDM